MLFLFYRFASAETTKAKIANQSPDSNGNTVASSINNVGDINRSFVDVPGRNYTALDDPNAIYGTTAPGINDSGQIVGKYGDNSGVYGFLDTPGTGFTILDFPGSSDDTVTSGINSAGQIVGFYFDASGAHSFLATPTVATVPEASTAVSLGFLCLGGFMMYTR